MMTTTTLPQNPFPGMNPYLERAELWHGVHTTIIAELQRWLAPRLRPEYMVRIEERMYVSDETDGEILRQARQPDVMVLDDGAVASASVAVAEAPVSKDAILVRIPYKDERRQRYLEVIRVSNREVVAVIELLSPSNKTSPGRQAYKAKRNQVFHSLTHLVEIDLLRSGRPLPVIGDVPASHYRILVAGSRRTNAELYVFGMRQPIPVFVMPLAEGSEGIAIDLKPIIDEVYVLGSYDRDIDYAQDPEPPLSDGDRVWLDQLLREQGLRGDGGG